MKTIGAFEKVSLPELDIVDMHAKIDTGADSSALHCHIVSVDDQQVTFTLWETGSSKKPSKEYTFPIYKKKRVRSSNGSSSKRVFIETVLTLGEIKHKTKISLTNRASMRYPILIGKRFLKGRCVVDVSQRNIG